jgi:hypothetical protein
MLSACALGPVGCQTPGQTASQPITAQGIIFGKSERPEIKPGKQPEVLTIAPSETRFNQSVYPVQAFRDMNSEFKKPLTADGPSSIQSTPSFGGLGTPSMFGNSLSGQPLSKTQ